MFYMVSQFHTVLRSSLHNDGRVLGGRVLAANIDGRIDRSFNKRVVLAISSALAALQKDNNANQNGTESSKGTSKDSGSFVAGFLRVRAWLSMRLVVVGALHQQTTNIRAGHSHALVVSFKGSLNTLEIRVTESSTHIVVNELRIFRVTGVDDRKNRSGKYSTLSLLLITRSTLLVIANKGISEGSLHKWDCHELLNCLLLFAGFSTLSTQKIILTNIEETHDFNVHFGGSTGLVLVFTASLEVCASLVSKSIKEVSITRSRRTLEGSGVKGNGFVPSMDWLIVTTDATFLAVIKSIFHFTNNVHPYIHVGGSLLDGLNSCIIGV
mmetsp:Transcript_16822/g.27931  ORF Transcript_16822/g.27931 Transcript_16822/m.27931 type:complete len:325 (+) Transcript_16822:24-998(+)